MYKKIDIESSIGSLRIVENVIDDIMKSIGISQDNYGKILVSTLEAVNNAITHGNKLNPAKRVGIIIALKNKELNIQVSDEGVGFRPDQVPDPTIPENIEALNGRGVFIMSKLADEISYSDTGSTVTMIFKNILD
jgi:anti-sigma regulatory factor (Ser/Thr protein kinase)